MPKSSRKVCEDHFFIIDFLENAENFCAKFSVSCAMTFFFFLENTCALRPWPREGLSAKSRSLVADFFRVLFLGLERWVSTLPLLQTFQLCEQKQYDSNWRKQTKKSGKLKCFFLLITVK